MALHLVRVIRPRFSPCAGFAAMWMLLAAPSGITAQGYAFIHGEVSQQLPQPTVTALHQTPDGLVWIGTQTGLYYYDGREVHTAEVSDEPRLGGSVSVRSILGSEDGTLWIGTMSGSLLTRPPGLRAFQYVPLEEENGWVYVEERGDGDIILGTPSGLRFFSLSRDERPGTPHSVCGDASPVRSLGRTPSGDILVGTNDGTAARVSADGRWTERWCAKMGGPVGSVLAESETALVATFGAGLHALDIATGERLRTILAPDVEPRGEMSALHRDSDGTLMIATRGGLALQESEGGPVEWLLPDPDDSRSIPDADVRAITATSDGSVWIGTWNGLAWLPPTRRSIGSIRKGLTGDGVAAITRIDDQTLLAGGLGGGLFTFDTETQAVRPVDLGSVIDDPRGLAVSGLAPDGQGAFVSTLGAGLLRFSGDRVSPVASTDCQDQPLRTLVGVLKDRTGRIWAGSIDRGLLALHAPSGRLCAYEAADGSTPFEGMYVWSIIETGADGLLFAVHSTTPGNGGVVSLDAGGEWRWLVQGANDGAVMTIHQSWDSTLWIGTEATGLIRVAHGEVVARYSTAEGLPNPNVNGILEDNDGMLWISTHDGLARLDPTSGAIRVFHESSGLTDDRFFANSAFKDHDGTLLFGGPSGITAVEPMGLIAGREPPAVALTAFRINGEEAPLDRAVEQAGADLEPHENFFTFTFAALDFADPSANRYRYQLVNLDENWIDNGTSGTANYTSVPPGDYTFRVAARASEGIWNEDALSIPVHVQTPWQDTLWARSAGVLLLLSIITGIYLYRLRQIEAREALRLGIAGKLHDDIGANLSAMALKTELVRTATELTEGKKKHLKDIGRLARDTAHKVRETAWIVNTEYDSLPGLASKMQDTAHTLLDGQVDVEFKGAKRLPRRPIDMELRQDTYLLFKELLQNVLKHSEATKAEIEIQFSSPLLQIRVQDNGVGFDMDEANGRSGNGLVMMRKRAEKHGGNVQFAPGTENGTNALLTMRMK